MASEIDGKIVKYSDLLNVVELNLGYYEGTDDANLNILCEFLKMQDNEQLKEFYEKYGSSEFGEMLYGKYMKVIMDKDRMERVANMQLYQEKFQLRYHTIDEADALWKKSSEKIAISLLKKNKLSIEEIAEATELSIERVKNLEEEIIK